MTRPANIGTIEWLASRGLDVRGLSSETINAIGREHFERRNASEITDVYAREVVYGAHLKPLRQAWRDRGDTW